MDLDLSDEQQLLVETTRRLLAEEVPIATVRALEPDPAGFPAGYWRRGAELGWTSMLVAEADGGGALSGHGLLDLVLVAEEVGRAVAPGPLVPVNLVAAALSAAGTPAQKAAVLPGLLDGSEAATWTGPDPVPAAADGDGWVLSGTASPVEAAAQSRHLLVLAATPDGPTHLLVPSDAPGLSVAPLEGLDLVRRFGTVAFDGVRVGPDAAVGRPGEAAAEAERLLQIACVLQCAEMAGAVDHMFQVTLEYLAERYSFGRPLSSYQALKHRMADDKLVVEACHAIVTGAVEAVATGADDAGELVSAAKAWVGPHATELLQDFVQLHGGIGVTWEHDLHLYLRRATVDRMTYGTPEEHRERLATALLGAAS